MLNDMNGDDELEIKAIGEITRILRELPPDARRRVIHWLEDRFIEYDSETKTWTTPLKGYPIMPPEPPPGPDPGRTEA